jgi:D-amino-acid oxidase
MNGPLVLLTCLTIVSSAFAMEGVVRKINPPRLDDDYLERRILCYRPMRHGMPNMSVEEIEGKIVAHNYGQGGSGWTLGPGAAAHVNSQLTEYATKLGKTSKITIIGAGALGLFTAYDLLQRGYNNIEIIAESFTNLASHNAGGLLAQLSKIKDAKQASIIEKIGIDTFKFYADIAQNRHAHFKEGARNIPAYFESRSASGLESYVERGVMNKAQDVMLDFGNGTKRAMVAYDDAIFIDTAYMMQALTEYAKNNNISTMQRKIHNFKDIDSTYIINCTGLGSSTLAKDTQMVSLQGHLVMLKNQNPTELQYMIVGDSMQYTNANHQNVKRVFYMFPKRSGTNVGVIGGTFIDEEEFVNIIDGARKFYGLN